jgi:hypothetical protein
MIIAFSSRSITPDLKPMLVPVRALSPVIITVDMLAFLRIRIAPSVSSLSLFSKTSNPSKLSSFSADYLFRLATFSIVSSLLAIARTLKPQEVYFS